MLAPINNTQNQMPDTQTERYQEFNRRLNELVYEDQSLPAVMIIGGLHAAAFELLAKIYSVSECAPEAPTETSNSVIK